MNASPIRNESGEIVGAVTVARDVTELTELERQKDNFIKVAAHELKTPVTIMKGFAQAILRRMGDVSPEQRKMLEAIEDGANRINRIVRELLDIFQRFYGAHTGTPYDYGGIGVGLYISREIISRHGGRMWFESEEGRGSAFHFSFPLRLA